MKSKSLIVGYGDVGKALHKILDTTYDIEKIGRDEKADGAIDVMHICYSFTEGFIKNTISYIKKYKPDLAIINSTVGVGTTRKIESEVPTSVVHSPVIGDHSDLALGINTFVKPIGFNNPEAGKKASEYFERAGIDSQLFDKSETTELGKLLLTTQYALNIAFHQEMDRMCKKAEIDFKNTINIFKDIYNTGYSKIRPEVVMSNLFPGEIGGSCLMPNIDILEDFYSSGFLEEIKKSNSKKCKKKKLS